MSIIAQMDDSVAEAEVSDARSTARSGARFYLAATPTIDLISTDVFDTLMLRTLRSESSRLAAGERAFSDLLRKHGHSIPAATLLEARLEAQRLAFRALDVRQIDGEVRFADTVERQLRVLGLPVSFVTHRREIELTIEKQSLKANRSFAAELMAWQRAGKRVIAISDTILDEAAVADLIRHVYGYQFLDAIYTSADLSASKRAGTLFRAVAEREGIAPNRMLHIGDDVHADVRIPAGLGIAVRHAARPDVLRHMRRLDGAAARLARRATTARRGKAALVQAVLPTTADAAVYGYQVFGPILLQFALLLWLYASQAEAKETAVLLFCTRGGTSIREVFARVMLKFGLPLAMRQETLMVSRLVAARAALLARSPAALEEVGREFRGQSFARVACVLGGRDYVLGSAWQAPFRADGIEALLFGPSGTEICRDMFEQNRLFERHLIEVKGAANRLILCDTGLYGSTQRLLAAGFPDLSFESVLFARSNYKNFNEDHFEQVTGLFVERNAYNPLDPRTSVLRFWHLIERLFEPAIPSVRWFGEGAQGAIVSNAGDVRPGMIDVTEKNDLLAGALAYIDDVPAADLHGAWVNADLAWHRLANAITRPRAADLRCFGDGVRSVDFGRTGSVEIIRPRGSINAGHAILNLRNQLWREGAIAAHFPSLKHALLPMLETFHVLRGLGLSKRR